MTALLAGATGLVGGHLLQLLLNDPAYTNIKVVTRKPLQLNHPKLLEIIVDFDQLETYAGQLDADVVFCCLGTTIKVAGSQAAFKKVDQEYPYKLAQISKTRGAKKYILITALGSSKNSMIFYNRVKGELEESVQQLGFGAFHIIQPALIIGERKESRAGEGVAQKLFPVLDHLMMGPLAKYKSIKAEQIAKAMLAVSKTNATGTVRHESDELQTY
jgi:uncharacterized protein YbjT (DUF2867 family)